MVSGPFLALDSTGRKLSARRRHNERQDNDNNKPDIVDVIVTRSVQGPIDN